MATPTKPYIYAHPQFDRENFEAWDKWLDGEGSYALEAESGLIFRRPKDRHGNS